MLSRDQILRSDDLPTSILNVPRWGGNVAVRAMRVGDPDYVARCYAKNDDGTDPSPAELHYRRMVYAVILSAVDEDGARLFRWDDAADLRRKHWNTVLDVASEAFRLAGPDQDDSGLEEGKELSETTPD